MTAVGVVCGYTRSHISSMLDKFGLAEAKTVSTPANFSAKLKSVF